MDVVWVLQVARLLGLWINPQALRPLAYGSSAKLRSTVFTNLVGDCTFALLPPVHERPKVDCPWRPNMRGTPFTGTLVLLTLSWCGSANVLSQQPATPPPEKRATPESPAARLATARTVLFTRTRGNGIPFDVIKSTVEDWGRFTTVDSRDKADLVVEVATSGGDSGVQVSSSAGTSPIDARPQHSSSSGVEFSDAEVTMTVYDARSKRPLWTATEKAKSAMKQTARENNLVQAAERLASKFHDKLEPPQPPPPKERD